MSEAGKAVFLSYASQDAKAAKCIADALRTAGVEVWFDQSELVGGDAWDAKIRKQIGSCALLIPIISAKTQARREGYFRLEWRLAVERMRQMDDDLPFLLPVVIDETKDAEAFVPDRFREVQWTRLPGGETPPAFTARVKKLLGGTVAGVADPGLPGSTSPAASRPALPGKSRPWLIPVIAGVSVAVIALLIARPWQDGNFPASGLASPVSPHAPSVRLSPARQLAAKSAKLHDQLENASRSDLELAEQYCKQALALDSSDAEVWAEYSLVNSSYIALGYDRSDSRLQAARTQADRAVKLTPESNEAQLALANAYRWSGATQGEAVKRLRQLVERMPGDRRVLRTLGNALRTSGQAEESLVWYTRAAALPGGDPLALFQRAMALEGLGRSGEATASLDESLALHPGAAASILKVFFLLRWGELDQARAVLDQVPAPFLLEDRGAIAASMVFFRQRQWDRCLGVLQAVPRDYFDDSYFRGPKDLLTGDARFHAGRKIAAEVDWRAALQLVNQRLAGTKDTTLLHLRKAELHARLQEADEAERALRTFQELQGGGGFLAKARIEVHLNRTDAAIQSLQQYKKSRDILVMLRQDPEWDPLRGNPGFQALLAEPLAVKTEDRGRRTEVSAPIDQKSVAVLAFANLSDDKANEYFSDGISEELLNVLAKVPGLKVSARTSAFYFKGKEVPIPEIARQLGVAYVVEGSVRKQGDKVRITAQLIKAADGFHVWSDTFTRDLKDIFAVQDEIARLIAKALSLRLGAGSTNTTATVNPEALRFYLEGRQLWNLRTAEALARADILFRRALELEPDFARALSGLADVGVVRRSGSGKRLAQREEIVAHAERAITLDPSQAEPHATLGLLEFTDWNFEAADRHFRRAFALNPSYAWARLWRGQSLLTQGRLEEAMAENQRALEADPLAPRIASNTALLHLLAGRPAEALASADRALSLLAGDPQARTWKSEALLMLGRTEEALQLAREARAINPGRPDFTYVLARAGNAQEVTEAVSAPDNRFMNRTRSLLAVGRVDEALAGLEADAQESVFSFQFVLFHPAFDEVRNNPRFVKMLAVLRMTEAHERAQAWRAANPPHGKEAR